MTRINAGIPVTELSKAHLLAEHREIKRICYRMSVRLKSDKFDDIPAPFYEVKPDGEIKFKELFWLDKGFYTYKRYNELYRECRRRGYDVDNYCGNWGIYYGKTEYWNDYTPTQEQVDMIRARINDRLANPKSKQRQNEKSGS